LLLTVRGEVRGLDGWGGNCEVTLVHLEDGGELHCKDCGTWRCAEYLNMLLPYSYYNSYDSYNSLLFSLNSSRTWS
jgi:hypothetical protein